MALDRDKWQAIVNTYECSDFIKNGNRQISCRYFSFATGKCFVRYAVVANVLYSVSPTPPMLVDTLQADKTVFVFPGLISVL